MFENRPYPYSQHLESWEKKPQLGIEPVTFRDGMYHIEGPTWTKQKIKY